MQRYCAYQDRCHQEVRSKLIDLGVYGDRLEEIIAELVSDNFLNEERFARSYARGKFRLKKWGRTRIVQELRRRKISDYCIRKALTEIEEQDYLAALEQVVRKKAATEKETDAFKRRAKLAAHALRRGYEAELVWSFLKKTEL